VYDQSKMTSSTVNPGLTAFLDWISDHLDGCGFRVNYGHQQKTDTEITLHLDSVFPLRYPINLLRVKPVTTIVILVQATNPLSCYQCVIWRLQSSFARVRNVSHVFNFLRLTSVTPSTSLATCIVHLSEIIRNYFIKRSLDIRFTLVCLIDNP